MTHISIHTTDSNYRDGELKPVLSFYAALQYIAKYASKADPRLAAFTEIFNQILNNSDPNGSYSQQYRNSYQRHRKRYFGSRNLPPYPQYPLYHSSWTFVTLNLSEETWRRVRGTGNNEDRIKSNQQFWTYDTITYKRILELTCWIWRFSFF